MKIRKNKTIPFLLSLFTFFFIFSGSRAQAAADGQSFLGAGVGFEVFSKDGSGTGFYFQGQAGYAFDSVFAIGLHTGFSRVGTVRMSLFDFGGFLQATQNESGLYGRLYLDGIRASTTDGGTRHGVSDAQVGFAPGAGVGLFIPSAGSFHLTPEISYRSAFLNKQVNLIVGTFSLVWDF